MGISSKFRMAQNSAVQSNAISADHHMFQYGEKLRKCTNIVFAK